ncbi:GNAT family N-acetyltransferase [archaeon]|nr:GNAT family N-acetyltransferase [archaeon]
MLHKIRKLYETDVDYVKEISKSRHISNTENKDGFLIFIPTTDQIIMSDHGFVAEYDGTIIGYVTCYSPEMERKAFGKSIIDRYDGLQENISSLLTNEYWFVYQAAVFYHMSKKGIGTNLIEHIVKEAKKCGIKKIYGEIALDPLNNHSKEHHEKRGWKMLAKRYAKEEDVFWGLYEKGVD